MQEHDQDVEDKELTDLYAVLSQEQPPSSMDDKILAEAHKAVEPVVFAKKASGPFSNWAVPVSLAAVIVLSVTVVVMIEKERPYSLTSQPEQPVLERMAESKSVGPKKDTQKNQVQLVQADQSEATAKAEGRTRSLTAAPASEKQEKPAVSSLAKRADSASRPSLALVRPAPAVAANEPMAKEKKKASTKIESNSALAESEVASAGSSGDETASDEVIDDVVPERETLALMKSVAPVKQTPDVSEQAQIRAGKLALTDPQSAISSVTKEQHMAVENIAEQRSTIQEEQTILTEDADTEAKENISEAAPKEAETVAAEQVTEMSAKPEAAFSLKAQSSPATALAAMEDSEVTAPVACHTLSVSDCVRSATCILQWKSDDKSYSCREPANSCERGFSQISNNREVCESTAGCEFVSANCFCLPGAQCDCKDGAPAMCVPQNSDE